MLGDLKNKSIWNIMNFEGIENWRKISLKLDINNGTYDLRDLTNPNNLSGEVSYLI